MLAEFEYNPSSLRNFQQLFLKALDFRFIKLSEIEELIAFLRRSPFREDTITFDSFYRFLAAVGEVEPSLLVRSVPCLIA